MLYAFMFIYKDNETAQCIGHRLTQSGLKDLNLAFQCDFRMLLHSISQLTDFLHPEHEHTCLGVDYVSRACILSILKSRFGVSMCYWACVHDG